jgi:hypothetical protein
LAKAWNKQSTQPGLCSFNLEALALAAVESGMGLPEALHAIADHGATDLAKRLTPDPAEVSPPVKLLVDRDIVVSRLSSLAASLAKATSRRTTTTCRTSSLPRSRTTWSQQTGSPRHRSPLRSEEATTGVRYTTSGIAAAAGSHVKTTRSFGG